MILFHFSNDSISCTEKSESIHNISKHLKSPVSLTVNGLAARLWVYKLHDGCSNSSKAAHYDSVYNKAL